MKNKVTIISFILMLAIGGCGTVIQRLSPSVSARSLATQTLANGNATVIEPTAQPSSTPTLDTVATLQAMGNQLATAQDSERVKQLEIDALIRQNAQYTAQAEANVMAIAQITQQVWGTSVSGTQTAIPMTETAFPLVATMQKNQQEADTERNEFIKAGPTMTQAAKDVELYVKFGDSSKKSEIFLRYAVGGLCIVLGLLAFVFLIYARGRTAQPETVNALENNGMKPIPPAPKMHFERSEKAEANELRRVDPAVPCTLDELLELAEGICRLGKTLAFGQWEGCAVHKRLVSTNSLRAWMVCNLFAHTITGSRNELEVTPRGQEFLEHTLENGEPPEPYTCMEDEEK